VIAATNKNLAEEVAKGTFREDLYYRLNVIAIHMPPLRQREGDIPLLVEHFLDKYRFTPQHPPAKISEEALEMLEAHDWPGNVRELENTIERAVILARGGVITREHLRLVNRIEPRGGRLSVDLGQLLDEKRGIDDMLAEVERRLLAEAMHRSSNQIEAAAALLGLTPAALEKRLRLREVPTAEPAAAT